MRWAALRLEPSVWHLAPGCPLFDALRALGWTTFYVALDLLEEIVRLYDS